MRFKPFLNEHIKSKYETKASYVCTCDLDHHQIHELEGGVKLQMLKHLNPDNRISRPTLGTIIEASEGAQFKVGQKIICKHFSFEDVRRNSRHFHYNIRTKEKLYLVKNQSVMFGINEDGSLEPREGILLGAPVYGKFADTDLELSSDFEGRRRDIVKVIKVWEGCTDFKVGDYVMVQAGGDYPFKHDGVDYIRVDTFNEDAYAITDSQDTYDSIIHKHVNHYKSTASINEQNQQY